MEFITEAADHSSEGKYSPSVTDRDFNQDNIDGTELKTAYDNHHFVGMLTFDELVASVNTARQRHDGKILRFISIDYLHPTKVELVMASTTGTSVGRMSEVLSICLATNETFIDRIPLISSHSLLPTSCSTFPHCEMTSSPLNIQPALTGDEFAITQKICKAYKPLADALIARGLSIEWLNTDAWCVGHTGPDCDATDRIVWPLLLICEPGVDDIPYARPIEGIEMRISLLREEVISFVDKGLGVFPVPKSSDAMSRYFLESQCRTTLKPIVISQPEGPSWRVSDHNRVDWEGWQFQVGFNAKEGVEINHICFQGRPVLHRFSFCEMVVPYGDVRPPHAMKNAFDAGEDGLGKNTNSLVLGCDCLGLIHYFDGLCVLDDGEIQTIHNAICMHEEDTGMAWKHTDWRDGVPHIRRGRRLTVSFICTIANYEYGFNYHFGLDGKIDAEVKLTGVLSTGTFHVDEHSTGRKFGIRVGTSPESSLYSPVHQHFFVARMDFAVDGVANRVVEMNAYAEPEGPGNPLCNGFYYEETVLESELAAVRDCEPDTARYWKVVSANRRNATGAPTAFKLVPAPKIKPFANLAKAGFLKRAQFLGHQLWVTAFDRDENFPGGDFPNQLSFLDGLPAWVQKDRNLVNKDIVMWHVFGVTHMPRLEDWPVMPTEHCGFQIKPTGFLDFSPVMDLPATSAQHCNPAVVGGGHGVGVPCGSAAATCTASPPCDKIGEPATGGGESSALGTNSDDAVPAATCN